ncbi:hypothetical protein [Beijerinckia mobilis]|uniref:hypothetical protein n=1 Tax=Beijerinckia mobilis TaxID=231434 RepID=UPI001AEC1C37|nr:hypothetical protein [Beijerinckia mobilis]
MTEPKNDDRAPGENDNFILVGIVRLFVISHSDQGRVILRAVNARCKLIGMFACRFDGLRVVSAKIAL